LCGSGHEGRDGAAGRRPRLAGEDHVEVVRIGADDFRVMLERFPGIAAGLETEAAHEESVTAHNARSRRQSTSRSCSPSG